MGPGMVYRGTDRWSSGSTFRTRPVATSVLQIVDQPDVVGIRGDDNVVV